MLVHKFLSLRASFAIFTSTRHVACQCSAATTTVTDAAAASNLASTCSTFSGSIAFATGIVGAVSLDGLQEITGDMAVIDVTQLTTISSNSLATIRGSLTLSGLTELSEFKCSQLTSIDTLILEVLPADQDLSFLQTLQQCSAISIDNTQINVLQGFALHTIDKVEITNNPYMSSINLQINNVTGSLTIEGYGAGWHLADISMPNLEWIYNMTIRRAASLQTPTLANINGSVTLEGNTFTKYTAPLLQAIGGTLALDGNSNLQNLTLPSLQVINGGLSLNNNTNLTSINQIEALTTVRSTVHIMGPVEELDLPNLANVQGDFIMNSTEAVNCSQLASLAGSTGVIKGKFDCISKGQVYDGVLGSNGTASTGSNSSNGLSTGAKAGIGIGAAVAILVLIYCVALYYRRRHRAAKKDADDSTDHVAEEDKAEVEKAAMLGTDGQRHELEQPERPPMEMPMGNEAQELPAKHGTTELGRSLSSKMPDGIESRHEMAAIEEV